MEYISQCSCCQTYICTVCDSRSVIQGATSFWCHDCGEVYRPIIKQIMPKQRNRQGTRRQKKGQGHTYVIKAECTGLYKIGKTTNISNRMSGLQSASPVLLTLLGLFIGQDKEQELHKQFDSKREHGEWFKLTNEDVKWVMSIYTNVMEQID